ncbi:MAG: aminotransferase class III-fold pyridoxal phosphate-dependent enzyme, partial [Bdellovibrionaceae bacterium]|nr:aminotransferase class III-fold pyridoxal phosphate-dependent enzyme [Pseudobdellovibrionaceae bacterium]
MNLIGHQISESEKVNQLVTQLVTEVSRLNEQIPGVRPPQAEHEANGKKWIEKTGLLRGRPLHYPYIGTGAGRGPYVELEDGSVKLDLINGIGIHLFGHGHPRVMAAAVRGALSDIIVQGNLEPNREYGMVTEKLVQLAGRNSRLKHAWLATCGTMANENALKIARQKHSPARMI